MHHSTSTSFGITVLSVWRGVNDVEDDECRPDGWFAFFGCNERHFDIMFCVVTDVVMNTFFNYWSYGTPKDGSVVEEGSRTANSIPATVKLQSRLHKKPRSQEAKKPKSTTKRSDSSHTYRLSYMQ